MILINWNLIPESSVLGVGCGNHTRFADIIEGNAVVDLDSGAGTRCISCSQYCKGNWKSHRNRYDRKHAPKKQEKTPKNMDIETLSSDRAILNK